MGETIHPMTEKIIVLHCKTLKNRASNMLDQFSKFNCSNVVFYTDYDAEDLTPEYVQSHYKSFYDDPDSWLEKIKIFPNAINFHEKQCNLQEISLTIKFGKVFESLSLIDFDHVIIMEDDAILCENFNIKVKEFLSKTPDDWDAIYFGECCNLHLPSTPTQVAYLKSAPSSRGGMATIFKKRTIDDLASTWFPFNLVSDWELAAQHFKHGHKVYWWEPTLAKQGSEIGKFQSTLRPPKKINYVTFCNHAFVDLAKNTILSFIKNVKSGSLTVYCSELALSELSAFLSSVDVKHENVSFVRSPSDISDIQHNYGSRGFNVITQTKFSLISKILQNHGNIYYVDSDVVFLKDPITEIQKFNEYDVIFQMDTPATNPTINTPNWVCAGHFFMKNNKRSLKFLNEIYENYNENFNDQDVIKQVLTKYGDTPFNYPSAKIAIFDQEKMQNGYDAFRSGWIKLHSPLVVHANYILGKNRKINTLKTFGLWFADNA